MYVSLSKTLKRFCGVRLGMGIRITKKNAAWMWLVLLFVCMLQAMWYMVVLIGWLVYAVCLLFWRLTKATFGLMGRGIRWLWRTITGAIKKEG